MVCSFPFIKALVLLLPDELHSILLEIFELAPLCLIYVIRQTETSPKWANSLWWQNKSVFLLFSLFSCFSFLPLCSPFGARWRRATRQKEKKVIRLERKYQKSDGGWCPISLSDVFPTPGLCFYGQNGFKCFLISLPILTNLYSDCFTVISWLNGSPYYQLL